MDALKSVPTQFTIFLPSSMPLQRRLIVKVSE